MANHFHCRPIDDFANGFLTEIRNTIRVGYHPSGDPKHGMRTRHLTEESVKWPGINQRFLLAQIIIHGSGSSFAVEGNVRKALCEVPKGTCPLCFRTGTMVAHPRSMTVCAMTPPLSLRLSASPHTRPIPGIPVGRRPSRRLRRRAAPRPTAPVVAPVVTSFASAKAAPILTPFPSAPFRV